MAPGSSWFARFNRNNRGNRDTSPSAKRQARLPHRPKDPTSGPPQQRSSESEGESSGSSNGQDATDDDTHDGQSLHSASLVSHDEREQDDEGHSSSSADNSGGDDESADPGDTNDNGSGNEVSDMESSSQQRQQRSRGTRSASAAPEDFDHGRGTPQSPPVRPATPEALSKPARRQNQREKIFQRNEAKHYTDINLLLRDEIRLNFEQCVCIVYSAKMKLVKIGASIHPSQPVLQAGNCRCGCDFGKLTLVNQYPAWYPGKVEKLAHMELANFQYRSCQASEEHREWFKVAESIAEQTVQRWIRFSHAAYTKEGTLSDLWAAHVDKLMNDESYADEEMKFGRKNPQPHHVARNQRLNKWLETGPGLAPPAPT